MWASRRRLAVSCIMVGVAICLLSWAMANGLDPGLCNTNLNMVHVRVDMSLPENQSPKPQLEDNEFIECFTVALGSLFEKTSRLENEGYAIDARVGTIGEGIELAKKWRL
jgi:ADP-ribose pyrophosphatase